MSARQWRQKPNRSLTPKFPDDGRRRAVALTYDAEQMSAPTLSAVGQGKMAERIIALAQEHDVPVRQDPNLVSMLGQLQVGQVIPPELYPVVAEVLAFVYRLKDKQAQTR